MTKNELFLELACPDSQGVSRWVSVTEFIGRFSALRFGNGGSWCRTNSSLAKKYIVEFDKSLTAGNSIDAVRLNGFSKDKSFNQKGYKRLLQGPALCYVGSQGFF